MGATPSVAATSIIASGPAESDWHMAPTCGSSGRMHRAGYSCGLLPRNASMRITLGLRRQKSPHRQGPRARALARPSSTGPATARRPPHGETLWRTRNATRMRRKSPGDFTSASLSSGTSPSRYCQSCRTTSHKSVRSVMAKPGGEGLESARSARRLSHSTEVVKPASIAKASRDSWRARRAR